jgi:DNA-binding response OmpR family regulator
VESEPGKGSTFSFTVPLESAKSGGRVLVLEDDPAICRFIRAPLEEEGFRVTIASDGPSALHLMRNRTPEIVLLDLKADGIDGLSLLKEIRSQWGLVPVVVHTTNPDGELMRQALQFSPFTVLSKPCSISQLIATVRGAKQEFDTSFQKKRKDQLTTTTEACV